MQTPIQKQKYKKDETHKGSDVKIDLSKYYQKQTPNPKNQKIIKKTGTEPEIYEYYPMSSKTSSKAHTYNKNKSLTQQFKYDDLYEYNPVTKVYEYKTEKGDKAKKLFPLLPKLKEEKHYQLNPDLKKIILMLLKQKLQPQLLILVIKIYLLPLLL